MSRAGDPRALPRRGAITACGAGQRIYATRRIECIGGVAFRITAITSRVQLEIMDQDAGGARPVQRGDDLFVTVLMGFFDRTRPRCVHTAGNQYYALVDRHTLSGAPLPRATRRSCSSGASRNSCVSARGVRHGRRQQPAVPAHRHPGECAPLQRQSAAGCPHCLAARRARGAGADAHKRSVG